MNRAIAILSVLLIGSAEYRAFAEDVRTDLYVTGALTPTGLERLGKPLSVITSSEIRQSSASNVGDLLAAEPGVSATSFAPGASRPIIRGQGKERVRIIENGIESGDVSRTSDDHGIAAEALDLQRIDILRGPSTLLYGSGAMGGVVNLIDNSIAEESVGAPVKGVLEFTGGDEADNTRSGFGALRGSIEKFNWYLSGFSRHTDDIQIPGFAESEQLREEEAEGGDAPEEETRGVLENSATRSDGFRAGSSWVWDSGFWGLSVRRFNSKYGVPGGHSHEEAEGDAASEEEEAGTKIDMHHTRWETRGEARIEDSFIKRVRWGGSLSNYEHNELEGEETGTRFTNKAIEGRVEVVHAHREGREGGWGVQFNTDKLSAQGEEAFIPTSRTTTPAIFAVEEFSLADNVTWEIGGRYESNEVDPIDERKARFDLVSASAGVQWRPNGGGVTTALNVSFSQRAPNATELFAEGPHVATQSFEIGREDLSREQSIGVEALVKKTDGRFRGSLSTFLHHFTDFISLRPTEEEEDGLQVYRYDMTRARFYGGELSAEYDLFADDTHRLTVNGQVDYVRAQDLKLDDPLPRITPLRGRIGTEYQRGAFQFGVDCDLVSSQDRTAAFERETDGYILLGLNASYDIKIREETAVTLFLRGSNLTDEEARVHTSFLKDVAPLRGRAANLGVMVRF